MKSISKNPYRTLGLLAGASAGEINTRVNHLRLYIEAEQEVPKDKDFGFSNAMGKPERTDASVDKAKAELNLDKDKVSHALFWFWNDNDISDEAAFDALKEGDTNTAMNIWKRLTNRGEVTERNVSAFLNLSTLLLYLSIKGEEQSANIENGLRLKIRFLESHFSEIFVEKVGSKIIRKETVELERRLLNQLWHDMGKTREALVDVVFGLTFAAKETILNEWSATVASDIQNKVQACSGKRKGNPEEAIQYGYELHNSIISDLRLLAKANGKKLTYSNAADSVAEELLQCSIDEYNSCQEDIFKLLIMLPKSIDLIHKAQEIVVGNRVKQRCDENLRIIDPNEQNRKKQEDAEKRREKEERSRREEERRRQEEARRQREEEERRRREEERRRQEEKERRRKQRISILGIKLRGNALWVGLKWVFGVSLFFFGLLVLCEYQWQALSNPANKYIRDLPYACLFFWFFFLSWGITSLVIKYHKTFGIFLHFLTNVMMLLLCMSIYPIIHEKAELTTFDKVIFILTGFFIWLHAHFQVKREMNKGHNVNMISSLFKPQGSPGIVFLARFFRSMTIPFIILSVIFIANLTVNPFWRAVFWIYGFLWVWGNINVMLACNMQYRNKSGLSLFWILQHVMLFLPEAGAFLIWYFNWLPVPKWVTVAYSIYGVFWLIATIGSLMQMKNK